MTTPRVTVPVEPTEAMMNACPSSFSPSFAAIWPKICRDIYRAMLSAAPAPEGGAGDDRLHGAISKLKSWVELIQQGKRGEAVEGSPIVDCVNDLPAIIRQLEAAELEIEGAFEAYEDAAPATREEAPAEAGELARQIDALLAIPEANLSSRIPYLARELLERSAKHLRAQPQDRIIGVLAEAVHDRMFGVASLHDPALALTEISDGGGLHEAVHELIRSLPPRVGDQSQAREDAQPVAWESCGPNGKWKRDDDAHDPVFRRKAELIVGIRFRPLYTHPAPDALRVAVSDAMVEAACSRFVSESDDIWSASVWPEGPDDDGDRGDGGRVRLISEADQHNIRAAMRFAMTDALAALQAEQKGGA